MWKLVASQNNNIVEILRYELSGKLDEEEFILNKVTIFEYK